MVDEEQRKPLERLKEISERYKAIETTIYKWEEESVDTERAVESIYGIVNQEFKS